MTRSRFWATVLFLIALALPVQAGLEAVTFTLSNGLKVIYLPLPGEETVSLSFVMPGTSQRHNERNAGIEMMLLRTMNKGSRHYSYEVVTRELDRMGAGIGGSVTRDYSIFGMESIRPFFERTLKLYIDALAHPLLDPKRVELEREEQLAGIRYKLDSPDSLLRLEMTRFFFQGHPYQFPIDGLESTVSKLTPDEIRRHHDILLAQADNFLVIAGDLSTPEHRALIEQTFQNLPHNQLLGTPAPALNPPKNQVRGITKPLPTRYIMMRFVAPPLTHPDLAPLKLAMEVLSSRLWDNVRTKLGLAYAVGCSVSSDLTNSGGFYISTTDEARAVPAIFEEIRRLSEELVPEDELTAHKNVFRTEYYQELEGAENQAGFLIFGEIYLAGYQNRHNFAESVRNSTSEDLRRVAKDYLKDFAVLVIGPGETPSPDLFRPAPPLEKASKF